MENLSLLEQLDTLLAFMISPTDKNDPRKYCYMHPGRCEEMLEKMKRDGYITHTKKETNSNDYIAMPTIEGRIFLSNGGYQAKALRDKNDVLLTQLEITWQKTLDEHLEQNQILLNKLTFWLAIGTGALSLIELAKILQPAFQYYCDCHFAWQKLP